MKTPGQIAYEEDCNRCPNYHTGQPRKAWHELGKPEQMTWERNPTPRDFSNPMELVGATEIILEIAREAYFLSKG
jgi:hypothetical protein